MQCTCALAVRSALVSAGGIHPPLVIALTLHPLDDALEFLSSNLSDCSWLWEHLGAEKPSKSAVELVTQLMGWMETRQNHPVVVLRIVCALGGLGAFTLTKQQAELCARFVMSTASMGTRVIELGMVWLLVFPRCAVYN